jgi:hypothetical protein
MQPAPTVRHVCPCLLLQVAPASQVPGHRPATGSSRLVTGPQEPLVHAMHVPQSLSAQQLPLGMQLVPQALKFVAQF